MAHPIGFSRANFTIGPPGEYGYSVPPLPVLRLVGGQLISCWELSPDELAIIARTRKVWLSVWSGRGQPPVQVAAELEQLVEG